MERTRELRKSNLSVTNILENSSVSCSLKLRQLLLGSRHVLFFFFFRLKVLYLRESKRAGKIFGYT